MNKEFIEVDDKIIITNDEGMKRPVNYRDNMEDILISEDIIEEIENTIPTIKNKLENLEKNKSFINIRPIGIMVCSILITMIILPYIGLFSLILPCVCGIVSKIFHKWDKEDYENTKNALNSQLELLEKTLEEENKKLTELINDRKIELQGKNNYKPQKVDKKLLEKLRVLLKFYYKCGYYKNEHKEYLDKGILEKRLSSSYSKEEIELVKEHLLGSGPKLRKTNKN